VIYLEVAAVVTRGQHFDIAFEETQPCIPRGQHLVALYSVGGAQRAIDITNPRDYRLVHLVSGGGSRDPVRLYWMDEHYIDECRIPENESARR
jgi:hypothetical protein